MGSVAVNVRSVISSDFARTGPAVEVTRLETGVRDVGGGDVRSVSPCYTCCKE